MCVWYYSSSVAAAAVLYKAPLRDAVDLDSREGSQVEMGEHHQASLLRALLNLGILCDRMRFAVCLILKNVRGNEGDHDCMHLLTSTSHT